LYYRPLLLLRIRPEGLINGSPEAFKRSMQNNMAMSFTEQGLAQRHHEISALYR
jgi:hypothetical protein